MISALGEDWVVPDARKRKSFARLRSIYGKTNLFWVALALASLTAQATKSASSSDRHLAIVSEYRHMPNQSYMTMIRTLIFAFFLDGRQPGTRLLGGVHD